MQTTLRRTPQRSELDDWELVLTEAGSPAVVTGSMWLSGPA
jgi:hypothetical protein